MAFLHFSHTHRDEKWPQKSPHYDMKHAQIRKIVVTGTQPLQSTTLLKTTVLTKSLVLHKNFLSSDAQDRTCLACRQNNTNPVLSISHLDQLHYSKWAYQLSPPIISVNQRPYYDHQLKKNCSQHENWLHSHLLTIHHTHILITPNKNLNHSNNQ